MKRLFSVNIVYGFFKIITQYIVNLSSFDLLTITFTLFIQLLAYLLGFVVSNVYLIDRCVFREFCNEWQSGLNQVGKMFRFEAGISETTHRLAQEITDSGYEGQFNLSNLLSLKQGKPVFKVDTNPQLPPSHFSRLNIINVDKLAFTAGVVYNFFLQA